MAPRNVRHVNRVPHADAKRSLTNLSRDLPSVVYFIRTKDDLIKIGHTGDLANRRTAFGAGWQRVLAIVPGSRDDEAAMHGRFAAHLARGREYFKPAPELIEYINDIRANLGVGPIL